MKTIEGQDLLPQVRPPAAPCLAPRAPSCAGTGARALQGLPCVGGKPLCVPHRCLLPACVPSCDPQGVFTMLLAKIYKRQK